MEVVEMLRPPDDPRPSPFFDGDGQPLRALDMVSREQRHALERGDCGVPNP